MNVCRPCLRALVEAGGIDIGDAVAVVLNYECEDEDHEESGPVETPTGGVRTEETSHYRDTMRGAGRGHLVR